MEMVKVLVAAAVCSCSPGMVWSSVTTVSFFCQSSLIYGSYGFKIQNFCQL